MSDEGMTLLAQGREAEIFLLSDGSVLKLVRLPEWNHRVDREAAALNALRAGGLQAPEVRGTREIDGRRGLVMERIEGGDLLAALGANPLLFARAARVMADVHLRMHQCEAPSDLPDLHDYLAARIHDAPDLPPHLAARALDVLAGLPRGNRLCHGDLHVGNLIGSWDAPNVIDWGDASRGDPIADVARTELLHRVGRPPPGSPAVIRVLAPIGGKLVAGVYLRTYRAERPIDDTHLRRWEFVRAAARYAERIEEERIPLRRFMERATRRLA